MTTDTTAGPVGASRLEDEFQRLRAAFDMVPSPEQYDRLEALASRIEIVMRPARKEGACVDEETGEAVDPTVARQLLTLADPRGWLLDAAQANQAEIVAAIAPHTSWRALDSIQRRALAYWRLLHPEFTYGTVSLLGPPSARARLTLNEALRARGVSGVTPGLPSQTEPRPVVIRAAVRDEPRLPAYSPPSEPVMVPEPLPEPTEVVVVPLPVTDAPAQAAQVEQAPIINDAVAADPVVAEMAPIDVPAEPPSETPAEKLTLLSRLFGKRAVMGVPMVDMPAGRSEGQAVGEAASAGPATTDDADDHIANRPVSGEAPGAAYAEADMIDEATLALLTADNMHPPADATGFIRFDPYGTDNSLSEAITAYFEKIELRIPSGNMRHLSERLAAFNHLSPDKLTDLPVGQYIWFPARDQLQHWLEEATRV